MTERLKVRFSHTTGAFGKKYPVEIMSGGAALLDYDADGDLDIYMVNGASLAGVASEPISNSLLQNQGEAGGWAFVDVTESSGAGDRGYGLGCAVGDFDSDGLPDLYVTNFGPNVLLRNAGGGVFEDVTDFAGVGDIGLGASASFADIDNDGHLDLYVTNYVTWSPEDDRFCGLRHLAVRAYCHPDVFPGQPDVLYRNNGDGTFTDITREAGVYRPEGKGLGVVCTDIDVDGYVDIFVANDSMENYLFHNRGDGTFDEIGLQAGVAFNGDGHSEACMGVDAADVDGNGLPDLVVGNLASETNTLYLNQGDCTFYDRTAYSGLGVPSLMSVAFGMAFADVDNDGDVDLYAANGHVLDNIEMVSDTETYKQLNQLFLNDGRGRFREFRDTEALKKMQASRSAAAGDLNNDGRIDLVIGNLGEPPQLLLNRTSNQNGWLTVKLQGKATGKHSNRDGIGARVSVRVGSRVQTKEVRCGYSYLSSGDPRVHFGLGSSRVADEVVVGWPCGDVDRLVNVEGFRQVTLYEGSSPSQ